VIVSSPLIQKRIDLQNQTEKFNVEFHYKDTPTLRFYLYTQEEQWQPTSDYYGKLGYTTGFETNSSPVVLTGVVSTSENYVDFEITEVIATGNYFAQVALYDNTYARQVVWGDGRMTIKKSPIGSV